MGISLTESAANRVKTFLAARGHGIGLRLGVRKTGCSGFAYVINYAETRKLPFGVSIDNTGGIAKSFGNVQLTPTSVLINKRGEIVKRFVGEPDFAALHQLVEKLLAEA